MDNVGMDLGSRVCRSRRMSRLVAADDVALVELRAALGRRVLERPCPFYDSQEQIADSAQGGAGADEQVPPEPPCPTHHAAHSNVSG